MSVELPRLGYADFSAFVVSAGATLRSPLGGDAQRINRLGDRFGLSAQFAPMKSDADAHALVAQLHQALREGVITHWPAVGVDAGVPGLVLVNGANQLGLTLNVDGVGTGSSFRHGQFGNFTAAGRLHLFQLRGHAVESSGAVALPIQPMIRKSPADNSAVNLTDVKIEGWLDDESASWTVGRARAVGLKFTVIEK